MTVVLDTHTAVFLWEGRAEVFGARGRHLLEYQELVLPGAAILELGYLREIGRLSVDAATIVDGLQVDCGVVVSTQRLDRLARTALDLRWTRDPFDRLIVAEAMLLDAALLTRDRVIAEHFGAAVW